VLFFQRGCSGSIDALIYIFIVWLIFQTVGETLFASLSQHICRSPPFILGWLIFFYQTPRTLPGPLGRSMPATPSFQPLPFTPLISSPPHLHLFKSYTSSHCWTSHPLLSPSFFYLNHCFFLHCDFNCAFFYMRIQFLPLRSLVPLVNTPHPQYCVWFIYSVGPHGRVIVGNPSPPLCLRPFIPTHWGPCSAPFLLFNPLIPLFLSTLPAREFSSFGF